MSIRISERVRTQFGKDASTNAYLAAWKANQTISLRRLKNADGWFNPQTIHMAAHMSIHMSVCLSSSMSIRMSIHKFIHSSTHRFNPACFVHTKFSSRAPLIHGISYITAFRRWLNGMSIISITTY